MRKRRFVPTKSEGGINITSLMDVLTIILIFLLVNYAEEMRETKVPAYITLPKLELTNQKSRANDAAKKQIVVFVSSRKIQVEKTSIKFRSIEEDYQRVTEAVSKLFERARDKDERVKTIIALHADEKLSYSVIDAIVVSAAMAGITEFQFLAEANRN